MIYNCQQVTDVDDVVIKLFFFSSRRRHTSCLSDWSSDVCSSDLSSIRSARIVTSPGSVTVRTNGDVTILADRIEEVAPDNLLVASGNVEVSRGTARLLADRVELNQIGRASCREGGEEPCVAA